MASKPAAVREVAATKMVMEISAMMECMSEPPPMVEEAMMEAAHEEARFVDPVVVGIIVGIIGGVRPVPSSRRRLNGTSGQTRA